MMKLCSCHDGAVRPILLICVIVTVIRLQFVVSARPPPAAGIAETRYARHSRRLLSCLVLKEPMYNLPSSSADRLPFCSTQYANTGAANGWVPVAADTEHEVLGATAADVVYAWNSDPVNPRTVSNLKCTGQINPSIKDCWAGNGIYQMSTFSLISCCSNQRMCYIKTGGCVL